MKRLILLAAVAFATAASPAHAQWSGGHTTHYTTGAPMCQLALVTPTVSFNMQWLPGDANIHANVGSYSWTSMQPGRDAPLRIRFDGDEGGFPVVGRTGHTFGGRPMVAFHLGTASVMRDYFTLFMRSNRMTVVFDNGAPGVWFSLAGSAAAYGRFRACIGQHLGINPNSPRTPDVAPSNPGSGVHYTPERRV